MQGEEVVIAKAGKAMVRLVPVAPREGPRPLGLLAGRVREVEGWWATDPELAALFYGDDPDEVARNEESQRGSS